MLQSGMGAHPGAFAPGQCRVTVVARFGTPGAESGSEVIKHVMEETGRRERKTDPGPFAPRPGGPVNSSYCPIKDCSAFSVRSMLTHRAEGSNNTTKRRGLRCGISGAGSGNLKSFSAPVREKSLKKVTEPICEASFETVAMGWQGGRRARCGHYLTWSNARLSL